MSPYISQRRNYIDNFFFSNVKSLNGKILDLGGKKINKRGSFLPPLGDDIKWLYLNNDPGTSPDYLCGADKIPTEKEYFDCIIISELLEHVPDPENVIMEAFRVLKKGGKCFITIPFLYRVHPDPEDHQRWTDFKLANVCKRIGFNILELRPMGGVFAVVNDFWLFSVTRIKNKSLISLINKILFRIFTPLLKLLDKKFLYLQNNITTGWSIVLQK